MYENLNRSNQDFSKYDSMRIEELEEILRADAMGPERDDSDVDEILYVMEVLAKKRRQNGIAGKTALEAYQEFQQHYLPMVEEGSQPKRKSSIIPFRRIAAVAASLVLVFSLSITANAFSFKDVWDAVVTWAQETFCFSMGGEVHKPANTYEIEYLSLADALSENGWNDKMVPTWIPDGYEVKEILVDKYPTQESYLAIYQSADEYLKISVQLYVADYPEQIEADDSLVEVYSASGIDYYIFNNIDQLQAVWTIENFECYISGKVTIDDLKLMIDSIEKGETL